MGFIDEIGIPGVNMIVRHNERQDDRAHEARQLEQQMAMQREFAQNGIRWKVEDAKRAGVSPYLALGGTGASYSPVSVGGSPNTSLSDSLSEMGQNISRAKAATATEEERQFAKLKLQGAQLDIEGKAIDNQIRSSELEKLQTGVGPAFPSPLDRQSGVDGQGDSRGVVVSPSKIYSSRSGYPGVQAGAINSLQYTREANGNVGIAPSEQAKERNEDDFIAETMWHMKNRFMPPAPSAKDIPIPRHLEKKGYRYWLWHPFRQEFVPSKNP